ncbi:MAG: DUF4249 domain-containing protein [Bacteroidota bacterium]
MLAIVAASLCLQACERFVAISPPEFSTQAVVSGLIQADRPWEVYISQTEGYFADIGPLERTDAIVWIELANTDTFHLPYTSSLSPQISPPFLAGYQTREPLPKAGNTYIIHVEVPGLEPITAQMVMPHSPNIIDASWEDSASIDPQGRLMSRLSLQLKDPDIHQRNYFFVYAETIELPKTNIEWNSEDPSIRFDMRLAQRDSNNIYSIFQQAQYISDEWFTDSIHTLDFFIPSSRMAFLANFYQGWSLKLACINEPFYRYTEEYVKQRNASNNPYAEPSPVYNNIQGGYGVWGGYSLDSLEFYW